MTPDWAALRQLRRACAIGMVIWIAILAFWQFAVPGKSSGPPPLDFWLLVVAFALLVPVSLVFAGGATRRLWRARRRLLALLPFTLLCASAWAFPSFASDAGLEPSLIFWTVPCALLFSSLVSALFIVFSASPPVPPSDPGMDGWTKPA
jgi:hypothetical protein